MASQKETIFILGGDGYLGWSLALAFAERTRMKVVIVDSLIKRSWEKEVKARVLVPLLSMKERIRAYGKIHGKENLSFEKVDLLKQESFMALLRKYKPSIVLNAAQQPSAPFSMMSPKNAGITFCNNIVGNLNVLWAIAEVDKDIRYLKLGSGGCYMGIDADYVPLKKVDMSFRHEGKLRRVLDSWLPMHATDFYHQSKISDFLVNDLCAKMWGLRILTIQQSTIFGATISENASPEWEALSTRFNYDSVFGTVLNRFVCQLAMGHPLTVYGDGTQRTGLISLSDTVENFIRLASLPLRAGEHEVVHNYSHRLSIAEIAERLMEIGGMTRVAYLKNPRKEHKGVLRKEFAEYTSIRLSRGKKERRLNEELESFIEFTRRYAHAIDTSLILPTVEWSVGASEKILAPEDGIPEERSILQTKRAVNVREV
jgi:UDP-sulfoquinovose synthase